MPDPAPLLVFDLDGTLADTAPDLIAALNTVLQGEGLAPVPMEKARDVVGFGGRALIQRGFAAAGLTLAPDRLEELFILFLAHYEGHIADATRLYPGVVDALDRFEAAGWRFAVCTNKMEHSAVQLLTALHLADRFRAICGQNTFAAPKPDRRALLGTIARAGGTPARSIMVGDSKTDIAAAGAAGVRVIAVDFGYTDRPIETYAPDRIISHFDALWDAVAGLETDGGRAIADTRPAP
jgi:phosphoglycolate phosphatase